MNWRLVGAGGWTRPRGLCYTGRQM